MVETKNVVTTKEQSTCQDLTRNKKFKGPCNMCGKTGHKARDCSQNPIDVSKIKEGKETILRIISLPPGIPPSSCITSRDKARQHDPTSWIPLTIIEGKNRQVWRLTASVGYPTLRLVHVRIGSITLDGMAAREVRVLDQSEMMQLI